MQTFGELPSLFWMLANVFDGLNAMTLSLSSQDQARVDRFAIQQRSTSSALASFAAMLGAKIAQMSQHLEECISRWDIQCMHCVIDIKTDFHTISNHQFCLKLTTFNR